jgi:4-hydroxy-tetrahydrodipicolinate reductase
VSVAHREPSSIPQYRAALGVEIERIAETIDRRVTDDGFDTPTGRIENGAVAAMRSTLTGYVDGEPRLVLDDVTRMRDDLAPDWPQPRTVTPPRDQGFGPASGRGAYRVEITGSPSIHCELELTEDGDHDFGARIAGAARLVNAIAAVAAAPPGMLSALDLPLVTGHGLVRPTPGPAPDSRVVGAAVGA